MARWSFLHIDRNSSFDFRDWDSSSLVVTAKEVGVCFWVASQGGPRGFLKAPEIFHSLFGSFLKGEIPAISIARGEF
jgi:hypothetical protein